MNEGQNKIYRCLVQAERGIRISPKYRGLEDVYKRQVYVSCESATLARDLHILCDGGYELEKIRAFDQFAPTGHVETVVMLQKKK